MSVRVAVITCSDRCSVGEATDTSGPAIAAVCEAAGFDVLDLACVPDDLDTIAAAIVHAADDLGADLVLTTGGTGLGPRDVAPEATLAVCPRQVPGIPEHIRAESLKITQRAMLSRGVAAQRGSTLVVNLPGSEKAVRESLAFFLDQIEHAVDMMAGGGHGS